MNDLISIIIPIYNAEKYLRKSLDSAAKQSYEHIEIIAIDDGSTDLSGNICDEYAERDSRFTIFHIENCGSSGARNKGIDEAAGEFIFFLDADDILENDALFLLIETYKEHNADITIGDFNRIRNDVIEWNCNRLMEKTCLLDKHHIIKQAGNYLKKPNRYLLFAYSWGRLFKTSIIKQNGIYFNIALKTFEDVAFNFEYLKYTNSLFFLKIPVYNHLIHDNFSSATMRIGDKPERMFGYIYALRNANEFMNDNGLDMSKEIGNACINLTIIQLIRTLLQINDRNKDSIHIFIRKIINNSYIRKSLSSYIPGKGESRIIPLLIKYRMVKLLVLVCKYKAYKRYGKKEHTP